MMWQPKNTRVGKLITQKIMFIKIQKSRITKSICLFLAISILSFSLDLQTIQASNINNTQQLLKTIDQNTDITAYLKGISGSNQSEQKIINCNNPSEIITLKAGTTINLRPTQSLNPRTVKKGQIIEFKVVNDVTVNGKIIIESGAIAKGTVLKSRTRGIFGRAAMLEIEINSVVSVDNQTIPLSSMPFKKEGDNKKATAWILFGISMIILWPLIFVPFFIKGEDVEISSNTIYDASVLQTMKIEIK